MHRFIVLWVTLLWLSCTFVEATTVASSSSTSTTKAKEWMQLDRAQPNELIKVRLAFVQPREGLHKLKELLYQVSDPSSPSYGHHLNIDQITQLIAPPSSHIQRVISWLERTTKSNVTYSQKTSSSSVTTCLNPSLDYALSINKDYLFVELPVCLAEELFGVTMYHFGRRPSSSTSSPLVSRSKGRAIIRSLDELSLSDEVKPYIEYVSGITNFPVPARRLVGDDFPGEKINPPIIKSLYNITTNSTHSPRSSQAVAEFEEAYFYPTDLPIFEKKFNLPLQSVAKIIGKNDPTTGYLGEASLDVQYIIGVGTEISTWVFSLLEFDLVNWAINVSSTPGAPLIHSISWGSGESGYDPVEMQRVDTEFQKLGLLGMSLFAASGDDGTGHTGTFWCGVFDPTFPATAPHVTAVGGTFLDKATHNEIAVSFSGGGFSNVFERPSYQAETLRAYLNNPNSELPPAQYFNRSGRAIPDVSALSTNFEVVIAGYEGTLSGTSAATPTFAAIISLINDARYQRGKRPLGFINPLLYKLGRVGHDITHGNNQNWYCDAGFQAVAGWDAVSGLGTPDFPFLLHALLNA